MRHPCRSGDDCVLRRDRRFVGLSNHRSQLRPIGSAGEVVSRAEIAEQVWEIGFKTDTNVVDVVVRRLRAKVDDPFKTKLVHTIRGVGYVLKAH